MYSSSSSSSSSSTSSAQLRKVKIQYVKPAKENARLKNRKGQNGKQLKVSSPAPYTPPLFSVDDPDSLELSLEYLKEEGYVVYGNVFNQEEVNHALGLLWDHLEGLGSGIKRAEPETWNDANWPPDGNKGILYTHSVGHSPFLWYLRGNPKVAEIFASIWKVPVSSLLTSFDGCCIMRPTSYNPSWRTQSGWYHLDQNGISKPGDRCYQGLVNLVDATSEIAPGIVMGAQSHKKFGTFFEKFPGMGNYKSGETRGDFVSLKPGHLVDFFQLKPKKLCIPAGAFVVWNSRTVHCNTPTTVELPVLTNPEERKKVQPERVVAYICMSPRPTDEVKLNKLLMERVKAVTVTGQTTTHWPDEFTPSRNAPFRNPDPFKCQYQPITPHLTDHQKRLAGLIE